MIKVAKCACSYIFLYIWHLEVWHFNGKWDISVDTAISTMCALVTLTYGEVMKPLGGPQYITLPVAIRAIVGGSAQGYLYDNKGRFCTALRDS